MGMPCLSRKIWIPSLWSLPTTCVQTAPSPWFSPLRVGRLPWLGHNDPGTWFTIFLLWPQSERPDSSLRGPLPGCPVLLDPSTLHHSRSPFQACLERPSSITATWRTSTLDFHHWSPITKMKPEYSVAKHTGATNHPCSNPTSTTPAFLCAHLQQIPQPIPVPSATVRTQDWPMGTTQHPEWWCRRPTSSTGRLRINARPNWAPSTALLSSMDRPTKISHPTSRGWTVCSACWLAYTSLGRRIPIPPCKQGLFLLLPTQCHPAPQQVNAKRSMFACVHGV